ncbi:hypothetical protein BD560DRAFT_328252 [Blakeslea trispora]|nr:hypothetical protein BD560DRAFT_328252 [Blakeslea trispora]
MLLYVVVSYKQSNTFYQCLIRSNSVDSYTSLESYESTNYPTLKNCVCISSFLDSFWAWDNYIDYINCLLLFTCFVGILYIFLHQYSAFIEVVGFIGLGCEATLPLPQLVTNFKQRSTKGFSLLILSSWFVGDGFKVFYFIYQNSPTQFILCAFVQLSLDVLLVLQFIVFSSWAKKLLNIQSTISLDGDIYNQC